MRKIFPATTGLLLFRAELKPAAVNLQELIKAGRVNDCISSVAILPLVIPFLEEVHHLNTTPTTDV